MAAAVSHAARQQAVLQPPRGQRQQHTTTWAPIAQRQPQGTNAKRRDSARRAIAAGVASSPAVASSAVGDLATYHFAQRHAGTASEWFQHAVKEIVKHVDDAPMLQTVALRSDGVGPPADCSTYSVHESVVAVPELWQSVAEHLSQQSPDVVILVQRVSSGANSPQHAMELAAVQQQQQQQQQGDAAGSPPGSPRAERARSMRMRVQAEEVCSRLVSSGVADAILLHGQVGDCCDGDEHVSASGAGPASTAFTQQGAPRAAPLPSIVPFGSPTARRAVRAAALRPTSSIPSAAPSHSTCYWGVVVQSRLHTGAEGCYLLKTVRNVNPGTGCTCTHFSLTRISQGEHLEQQFVKSWLL